MLVYFAVCGGALTASASAQAAKGGAGEARASASNDIVGDLAALARQRPWQCRDQQPFEAPAGWEADPARCAWQERLRMRRWTGPGGLPRNACVSVQARWWAWARGYAGAPALESLAWHSAWTTQSLAGAAGSEQRIVVLRALADGRWEVREWRWDPSPRAATRRWQAGRWAELAARASQLRSHAPLITPGGDAGKVRSVLLANMGKRPSEATRDVLHYQAGGLCLQVDPAALGAQQLQLPYSAEDSRQEQRAAMQLQLARRYPQAVWLTPFAVLPMPPSVRGGAKFYAIWTDEAKVNGQLWIPARGEGALVRVRIASALPNGAGAPDAPEMQRVRQVVERELTSLALTWARQHE